MLEEYLNSVTAERREIVAKVLEAENEDHNEK
jgi:hypothetical protein